MKETWSTPTQAQQEFYFYGVNGQKLVTLPCTNGDNFSCGAPTYNVYFGGKLVVSKGVTVVTDRLGSVRANTNGERFAYFPYGEERTNTADNREKFGTYFRDPSSIGPGYQDYADQRYYGVGSGRFYTADPYQASGGAGEPGSWNRYAYVGGDPVNRLDPTGAYYCYSDGDDAPAGCRAGFGLATPDGAGGLVIAGGGGGSGGDACSIANSLLPVPIPCPGPNPNPPPPTSAQLPKEPVYDAGFDQSMKTRATQVANGLSSDCKKQLSAVGITISGTAIDQISFFDPSLNGDVMVNRFGSVPGGGSMTVNQYLGSTATAVTTWGARPNPAFTTNSWILGSSSINDNVLIHEVLHGILQKNDDVLAGILYPAGVSGNTSLAIAGWLQDKCGLPQ
jgi:RHS repeat-associated protein